MKTILLAVCCLLSFASQTLGQSFEIKPDGGLVKGDSSQLIIGKDTSLAKKVQLFTALESSDSLIWLAKNSSFETSWSLSSNADKNAFGLHILNSLKPAQFDIKLPQGQASFNNSGNLLLGGANLGDTSNVLLDVTSRRQGAIITASGVAISTAARITHTQSDTSYNEVHGVYAHSDSANFVNSSFFGEAGTSGSVANIGVIGRVYEAPKPTAKYIGIVGIDVVNDANSYAGEFQGKLNVIGDVTINGSIAKSSGTFRIDHPQDPFNKYLYHSFVESPDMMNVYNGNITTGIDSLGVVTLPAYFESLNKDFRYQLTVMGQFAQAIVFETISSNQFTIKTDKPSVQVSWQITGIRKDDYANDHRVVPEQLKPANEQGTRLYTPSGGGTLGEPENSLPASSYPR